MERRCPTRENSLAKSVIEPEFIFYSLNDFETQHVIQCMLSNSNSETEYL